MLNKFLSIFRSTCLTIGISSLRALFLSQTISAELAELQEFWESAMEKATSKSVAIGAFS